MSKAVHHQNPNVWTNQQSQITKVMESRGVLVKIQFNPVLQKKWNVTARKKQLIGNFIIQNVKFPGRKGFGEKFP